MLTVLCLVKKLKPCNYNTHPHASMLRFAEYLELQDFRQTTAANYYRALRLLSEHFDYDPSGLTEEQIRSYFVHVRSVLNWAPKSCRQHLAALKHFYRGMLGLDI